MRAQLGFPVALRPPAAPAQRGPQAARPLTNGGARLHWPCRIEHHIAPFDCQMSKVRRLASRGPRVQGPGGDTIISSCGFDRNHPSPADARAAGAGPRAGGRRAAAGLGSQLLSRRTATRGLAQLSDEFGALVSSVSPSVVQIVAIGYGGITPEGESTGASIVRQRAAGGSGVILHPDGYIVTNAHVVAYARRVRVTVPTPSSAAGHSIVRPTGRTLGCDHRRHRSRNRSGRAQDRREGTAGASARRLGSVCVRATSCSRSAVRSGSRTPSRSAWSARSDGSARRKIRWSTCRRTRRSIRATAAARSSTPAAASSASTRTSCRSPAAARASASRCRANIVRTVFEQLRTTGRVRRGTLGVLTQTITPVIAQGLVALAQQRRHHLRRGAERAGRSRGPQVRRRRADARWPADGECASVRGERLPRPRRRHRHTGSAARKRDGEDDGGDRGASGRSGAIRGAGRYEAEPDRAARHPGGRRRPDRRRAPAADARAERRAGRGAARGLRRPVRAFRRATS